MTYPANLTKHFEVIEEEGISVDELFRVPRTPPVEKALRKYAAPIFGTLPPRWRYASTDLVKRLRNPSNELKLKYPLDFEECQRIAKKLEKLDLRPWWKEKAVICVCHDVDTKSGADFVQEMADINRMYDLKSTFNFLTNDNYVLDKKLLNDLHTQGFEIGLHGYTHDQGFAFRGVSAIRSQLKDAMKALDGLDIVGYRSPALSLSDDLFTVLNEENIVYDSSLQTASPFYKSVKLPYPVYLSDIGVWELPLTVQDDNYFRDTKTDENKIFESIGRFIEEMKVLNGVFVINMHPHNMVRRQDFYKKFVQFIKSFHDITFKTTKEVVEYAKGHDPIQ